MSHRSVAVAVALCVGLSWPQRSDSEVTLWKLGGRGLQWSQKDTASILIDFGVAGNAIQPIYIAPDRSVFTHLTNWSALKTPRELGYQDGERPRAWRGGGGSENPGSSGIYLVDGDSLSSNTPGRPGDFYTIDLAVPVPVHRFGFFTPPRGFRTDGTPKVEDVIRAYQVTIAEAGDPARLEGGYQPIGPFIGSVQENFAANVQMQFPKQYVRYIRYYRGLSSQDETFVTASSAQAREGVGSIGDFELYGSGVPKRVTYVSQILPLEGEVNLGRLHFTATPFRVVQGEPVVTPSAEAAVRIIARVGTDDDPNVYHEFTNTGGERVVSRQQYENLSPRRSSGSEFQIGKPGIRATIAYDEENWSYWSRSFHESGEPLVLRGGSFLQLKINLESGAFDDFVRLDSLWIELSPLLARNVVGEIAPLEDPRPLSGVAQVELGVTTDFVLDLRSSFDASTQRGFDAVRVRTGAAAAEFKELQMGSPLAAVEPEAWEETEDGVVIFLPRSVTRVNNVPVRVLFSTSIFTFAQTFETEVFDRGGDDLPQSVRPGDASADLGTDDLRVLATEGLVDVISGLRVPGGLFSPNGDGINDVMEIGYDLVRLADRVPARLRIYDLAGRRLAAIDLGHQGTGPQRVAWDGTDGSGRLLPPGLYVAEIAVESESRTFRRIRSVGLAY